MTYLKSAWTWIKWFWATSTSLVSDILKIVWPQWLRAETMWKAWTWTKRGMAVGILAVSGFLAWKFSVDITRLSIGSYRAASAYGRGVEITKSDLRNYVTEADFGNLQRQIDSLKSELASIDDKIDKAEASKITTGTLPAKKTARKSPAKKSSFSVSDPSTWSMP